MSCVTWRSAVRVAVFGTARNPHFSLAIISVTVQLWIEPFPWQNQDRTLKQFWKLMNCLFLELCMILLIHMFLIVKNWQYLDPFQSYVEPRLTIWFSCSSLMSEDVRHGFFAFVRPLSEPVRRFSSCSTDFSQQIAQVVLFLFLFVFLF
jgi:hypothetical protein